MYMMYLMMYVITVFENLRFRPSTRKRKPTFSRIFNPLESVLEKMRFRWLFSPDTYGRWAKPEKKNIPFQTKTETCGRGLSQVGKRLRFCQKEKKNSSDGNFISVKYIAWMSNYDNIKFTMHFFKVKFIVTCLIFNKSKKLCFCVHDYCGEAVRFFYTSKESGRLGILGNISSLTASIIFS